MEPLEPTLVDELLRDFSGDAALPPTPPGQRRHRAAPRLPPPSCSPEELLRRSPPSATPIMHPSLLDGPVLESLPAFVEEELEWLLNKDAFPTLDTFDISATRKPSPPPANPKRPSPVSVLDGGPLTTAGAAPPPPPPPPLLQWASGRARSKGRRRRGRALPVFRRRQEAAPREKRRCWHCAAEETPQWRAGPQGPKTLCNACGVRYKSGRLLPEYRPANSPTFSGDVHSNSHRKVMEMRRKKEALLPTPAAATTMTKKKGLLLAL